MPLNKGPIFTAEVVTHFPVATPNVLKNALEYLESRALEGTTLDHSNPGCYRERLEDIQHESIDALVAEMIPKIEEALEQFKYTKYASINLWANVNAPGSFNDLHMHPMKLMSGCYYLQAENTGSLTFVHPANHLLVNHLEDRTVVNASFDPSDNCMICFPSWIPHKVEVNTSNKNRVNIAFNVV